MLKQTYLETQSKVLGGTFFPKIVNDFSRQLFLQESSVIDIQLDSK